MGQNPFLKPFYDGRAGAAFQTELFFLLSRYRQQQELVQRKLFAPVTLSDYVFEKSKLFAYLNLEDSELLIYEKLYALLAERVPRPDLVVYLQAPTEVLMKRIRTRGRPEEARLSEEYLAEVNRAYNHYFFHYTAHPAPRREHHRRGLREARGGRGRPAEADPVTWARARSTTSRWRSKTLSARECGSLTPGLDPSRALVHAVIPRISDGVCGPFRATAADAPLRRCASLGRRRACEAALAPRGREPVRLTLTENRSVLLSFRRTGGSWSCACTGCSCTLPCTVVRAVARGLRRTSRARRRRRCGGS